MISRPSSAILTKDGHLIGHMTSRQSGFGRGSVAQGHGRTTGGRGVDNDQTFWGKILGNFFGF